MAAVASSNKASELEGDERPSKQQRVGRYKVWVLQKRLADLSAQVEAAIIEARQLIAWKQTFQPLTVADLTDEDKRILEVNQRARLADVVQKHCSTVLKTITQHKWAFPFINPVDTTRFPDYPKVISTPMDFSTIRIRQDSGYYREPKEWWADVMLVFANAKRYNAPGSDCHLMAQTLQEVCEEKYDKVIAPRLAEEAAATLREEMVLKRRRAELVNAAIGEAMDAQGALLFNLMAELHAAIREAKLLAASLCEPLTLEEKQALAATIQGLPTAQLESIVAFVASRHPPSVSHSEVQPGGAPGGGGSGGGAVPSRKVQLNLGRYDPLLLRQLQHLASSCTAAQQQAAQQAQGQPPGPAPPLRLPRGKPRAVSPPVSAAKAAATAAATAAVAISKVAAGGEGSPPAGAGAGVGSGQGGAVGTASADGKAPAPAALAAAQQPAGAAQPGNVQASAAGGAAAASAGGQPPAAAPGGGAAPEPPSASRSAEPAAPAQPTGAGAAPAPETVPPQSPAPPPSAPAPPPQQGAGAGPAALQPRPAPAAEAVASGEQAAALTSQGPAAAATAAAGPPPAAAPPSGATGGAAAAAPPVPGSTQRNISDVVTNPSASGISISTRAGIKWPGLVVGAGVRPRARGLLSLQLDGPLSAPEMLAVCPLPAPTARPRGVKRAASGAALQAEGERGGPRLPHEPAGRAAAAAPQATPLHGQGPAPMAANGVATNAGADSAQHAAAPAAAGLAQGVASGSGPVPMDVAG